MIDFIKKPRTLIALFSLLYISGISTVYSDDVLTLPLRFHVIDQLVMQKDNLKMGSWVSEQDIRNTLMPEVNRIWKPADIKFRVDHIMRSNAIDHRNKSRIIDYVVNARRNREGKSDPKRIRKLAKLIDWTLHDADVINIYLVPYLGETSQGNTRRSKNQVLIGQWTDKPSGGRQPPQRFQLVEPGTFKDGSMGRTIAHEIGHVLGLKHPDKATQSEFKLLMGGRNAGYRLTTAQVTKARRQAKVKFPP